MDLGLRGKRVIVTGATRGIGRAIAEHFAREGCDLAFCARTAGDIPACQRELQTFGANVVADAVDVGAIDSFKAWLTKAVSQLGGLDIFISNVSAQSFDWDRTYQIDIKSCVAGVEMVVPHLRKSKAASIVAIGSQAALFSAPSYKAYAAMKAALLSYMSSVSRELAPEGIRVNVVSPSEIYFKGGFWERMQQEDEKLFRAALAKNISGRFGTPDEVARAVVFIASPAASFISGSNFLVDFASREHVQF